MPFLPAPKPTLSGPIRHAAIAVSATALLACAAFAAAPSASGQSDRPSAERPVPPVPEPRLRELSALAGRGSQLGVSIRDNETAGAAGVVVEKVTPGSPAERAGLQKGDVVVEFDGERVRSARQFARLVQETPPGRQVKAAIVRDGKRTDIQLTPDTRSADLLIDRDALERQLRERLGDLQIEKRFEGLDKRIAGDLQQRLGGLEFDELARLPHDFMFDVPGGNPARPRLGVTLQTLTPQLARFLGATEGVLVASVEDGSAAASAGIKAGDVIVAANNEPIRTRDDLAGAMGQTKTGEALVLKVVRDKQPIEVRVQLPARQ